jgi:hypothetical protein
MACPNCGATNVAPGGTCAVCGTAVAASGGAAGGFAAPELDLKRRPSAAKVAAVSPPKGAGARELELEEGEAMPDLGIDKKSSGVGVAAATATASKSVSRGAPGVSSGGAELEPDEDDLGGPALELASLPPPAGASGPAIHAGPASATITPSGKLPQPMSSGHLPDAAPSSGRLPAAATSSGALPAVSGANASGPVAPIPVTRPAADDPAARHANYGDPPQHFWQTPLYAYRVLMRQMELKRELAEAKEQRSTHARLVEAALHAHDQKAVTTGLILAVGAALTLLLLFCTPVIVRFIRLAQD